MTTFRRFLGDRSGSYIPMFGFLVVPLVGLVGAATDYARAVRVKTEIISTLDQTALALSREIGVTDSQAKLNSRATEIFNALSTVQSSDLTTTIAVTATSSTNTITVNANSVVKSQFMSLLGISTIPVAGTSTATWGSRKIDIVMVLDNTGSMAANNKMTELKKAAALLVDTFVPVNQATPDTIRIGVVPFTTMVRTPSIIRSTTSYFKTYDQTFDRYGRRTGTSVNNSVPTGSWQGCVVDRDQSYDTLATAPTNAATRFPAVVDNFTSPQGSTSRTYCSGLQEVLPLTADLNSTKTPISNMNPAGNTNVTIGVAWGMQALAINAPLTQSRDPASVKDLSKVMIVLTDGDNTESRFTTTGSQIDARTAIACTNAKAAGIRVYTIRLMNGDEALLKACATTSAMYYSVNSASQLTDVFASIAREIADLRLAK